MIQMDGELLLVGCGRMGGALLEGWLSEGLSAERVFAVTMRVQVKAGRSAHYNQRIASVDDG